MTDEAGPPLTPVPRVTPDVFHGLLGEIVETARPTTEADPVGILASLLAGVAVSVGPATYVQIGNTRHPLLVWPLLFGRTGSGRKGEAGETASVFLHRASATYLDLSVTGLSSGEGLIERIRDPNENDEKDMGGTEDKRLAVTEPEFGSVMARAKREGSTLGYVLREAWTGKPLSVLNRRALHASSSHVGITGHISPKEFRDKLAEADLSGGTFNRFLPIYVERSQKLPLPTGVAEQDLSRLSSRLRHALSECREMGAIGMTPEAEEMWRDGVYDRLTEADDEDCRWTEFARRAAPYCRRIAALYAALDGQRVAGKAHLVAAEALVAYSIDTAKYVLDPRQRDIRIDRIDRAMDGAGERGLSRTQIAALFSRNLAKKPLDELLGRLVESGEYEITKEVTGGRPAERYRRTKKRKNEESPDGSAPEGWAKRTVHGKMPSPWAA